MQIVSSKAMQTKKFTFGKETKFFKSGSQLRQFYDGRCLSPTLLTQARSQKQLQDYLDNKMPQTRQTIMGSLVHTAILERHAIRTRYSPFYFTKIESVFHRRFVDYHDFSTSFLIQAQFDAQEQFRSLLMSRGNTVSMIEQVFFYTLSFEGHKFGVRGTVDIAHLDEKGKKFCLFDVKTSSTATKEEFEKKVKAYNYDLQMFMYSKFCEIKYGVRPKFNIILVAKEAPFKVSWFELEEKHYLNGEKKFADSMVKVLSFMEERGYNSRFEKKKQATAND